MAARKKQGSKKDLDVENATLKERTPDNVASETSLKQEKTNKPKTGKFVIDKSNAKECGYRGGVKSGETRRAKRDAREAMKFLLELPAKGNLNSNLKELGYSESERTNLSALMARLFTIAMQGNLDAVKELLKIAGYDCEENRKERESVASDERRDKELDAKINALMGKSDGDISINMNDEDNNNDVVIYMPQIASEEECQIQEEAKPISDGAEEG